MTIRWTTATRFLLIILAGALPAAGSEGNVSGSNDRPIRQSSDYFLVLMATVESEGQNTRFLINGQTNLPDASRVDLCLFYREETTGLIISTRTAGGHFETRLESTKLFLPGYYALHADYIPWRQRFRTPEERDAAPLEPVSATFPVRLGNPEDILAAKERGIEGYRQTLSYIVECYKEMRKVYVDLIDPYDSEQSPLLWEKNMGQVPAEALARQRMFRKEAEKVVIPYFPRLHSHVDAGLQALADVYLELQGWLEIDPSKIAPLKGKSFTFDSILKQTDLKISDTVKSIESQILLEDNAELRDLLVHQVGEMFWLYEHANQAYETALSTTSDTSLLEQIWTRAFSRWNAALDEIEKGLIVHDRSRLNEVFPRLVRALFNLPKKLRELWSLYSDHILQEQASDRKIDDLRAECHALVTTIIDALGFSAEIKNRPPLAELAEAGGEDFLGSYVAHKISLLGHADQEIWEAALSELIRIGQAAIPALSQALDGEVGETALTAGTEVPLGEAHEQGRVLAAVVLAHSGSGVGVDTLLAALHPNEASAVLPTLVREHAARALGRLRRDGYIEDLARAAHEDIDDRIRAASAAALGYYDSAAAVDALLPCLSDEHVNVRIKAKESIQRILSGAIEFEPTAPPELRQQQLAQLEKWWEVNQHRF